MVNGQWLMVNGQWSMVNVEDQWLQAGFDLQTQAPISQTSQSLANHLLFTTYYLPLLRASIYKRRHRSRKLSP